MTDVHAAPTGGEGGEFVPFHDANPVSDGWERLAPAIELCLRKGAESLLLLGDLAHLGDEGASGFLLKDVEPAELLRGIRVVSSGDGLLAPTVMRRVIETYTAQPDPRRPSPPGLLDLTERETDVLRLVARGLTNAEIAVELFLSPLTAKTHVSRIMAKLHARTRADLVIAAYEGGIVLPGRSVSGPS